jgi:hypothetical protein
MKTKSCAREADVKAGYAGHSVYGVETIQRPNGKRTFRAPQADYVVAERRIDFSLVLLQDSHNIITL